MGTLQAAAAAAAEAEDEKDNGDVDLTASTHMSSAGTMMAADGSSLMGVADDDDEVGVTVRLEHKDLWDKFDELGTEMVITKSGRLE